MIDPAKTLGAFIYPQSWSWQSYGISELPKSFIYIITQTWKRFIPITKTAQMMCLSRYWKELIRSSPLLWKSLDLSHYNRKIDNNALASLLSYSKDTIVDLSLANCSSISTLKPLITHRCRNLTSLDLSHTKLKNALIIEALKCMGKNVTSLSLSTTKVDNDTVRRILDICRKLERLSLVDCINLNDTAFEICDKFVAASIPMALKHFDASGTLITDKSIASLVKAAPRLQSINLSQNKKITNRSLVSLSSAKDLDVLILSGASLSNPPAFPFEPVFLALLANTTNLKVLELPNLPFLTDTCLEALATLCPGLESINIRGSANITSRGISFLAACPLKHVNISTCPRLQNECVIHIFSVPTLQTIDLSSLGQLTDAIFETIEGQASNLTSLKIRSNPNITSQGIPKLTKKAGCQLNELNVDNCPRVSRDSLSVIKKSFPACKISSLFTWIILDVNKQS